MALLVQDPIWNSYITPVPAWPLPPTDPYIDPAHSSLEGWLGIDYGADRWGTVPGTLPFLICPGQNGKRVIARGLAKFAAAQTPPVKHYANYWKADTFTPDHYSECSHNPSVYTGWSHNIQRDCGPAVRMSPHGDTCYAMGLWYHDGGNGHPDIFVSRINNGVETVISGVVPIATSCHMQDWWFIQLQVWGQNPVRLRVVTKAPTCYVLGSGQSDEGYLPGILDYNIPEYFAEGTLTVWQAGDPLQRFGLGEQYGNWAEYGVAPLNSDAVAGPGRIYPVWEGVDASPDRILSGQPGMRGWASAGTTATIQGLANFVAGDLDDRLTANAGPRVGNVTTLRGYKPAGSLITVT